MSFTEITYKNPNIQTFLAILLGYFLILIGFDSKSAAKSGKNILIKSANDKDVIVYAVLLLLFSCLAIFVYVLQYGGLLNALSSSILIRSGLEENKSSFLFFKHFMYISFFSSYLLCSYILIKKTIFRNFLYITLSFSVFISFIAAMLSAGRALFLNYLLAFFLVYFLTQKGKKPWLLIITIACAAALFLLFGKHIFFSLTGLPDGIDAVVQKFQESVEYKNSVEGSDSQFSLYKLMKNFAAPIISLDTAFNTQYDLRLFVDWIYGFLSFIPENLTNIEKPKTITDYNTWYIARTDEFAIPPGFLAFGIYSLSWPGLIIVTFTYGWISRYLQNILSKHFNDIAWMPFLYVLTAQVLMDFQLLADPRVFLMNYVWLFVSTFFLLTIVGKVSIGKPKDNQIIANKN